MSVEQAGNQVRIIINDRMYPCDARALAATISAVADAADTTPSPAAVAALTSDVQAAVMQIPDAAGRNDRAAVLKAVATYLAQAGYTKPPGKP